MKALALVEPRFRRDRKNPFKTVPLGPAIFARVLLKPLLMKTPPSHQRKLVLLRNPDLLGRVPSNSPSFRWRDDPLGGAPWLKSLNVQHGLTVEFAVEQVLGDASRLAPGSLAFDPAIEATVRHQA
jgi:hypothetical protein